MKIRPATAKDMPELVRIWKDFMKEHNGDVIAKDARLKRDYAQKKGSVLMFEKFALGCIRKKDSLILVADDDGIEGYILCYVKDNIPIFQVEKLGYISDLYVRPRYRGKGISTRLKDEAVKWFRKQGIRHLSIMVSPYNEHAHSLYRKWGFYDYHIELRRKN